MLVKAGFQLITPLVPGTWSLVLVGPDLGVEVVAALVGGLSLELILLKFRLLLGCLLDWTLRAWRGH